MRIFGFMLAFYTAVSLRLTSLTCALYAIRAPILCPAPTVALLTCYSNAAVAALPVATVYDLHGVGC
jgi:hypothetical protein